MRSLIEFIFVYAFTGIKASSIRVLLLIATLVVYQLWFIVLPRIRDVGMRSRWLVLVLIPGANVLFGIILLFRAPVMSSTRRDSALQATAAITPL